MKPVIALFGELIRVTPVVVRQLSCDAVSFPKLRLPFWTPDVCRHAPTEFESHEPNGILLAALARCTEGRDVLPGFPAKKPSQLVHRYQTCKKCQICLMLRLLQ